MKRVKLLRRDYDGVRNITGKVRRPAPTLQPARPRRAAVLPPQEQPAAVKQVVRVPPDVVQRAQVRTPRQLQQMQTPRPPLSAMDFLPPEPPPGVRRPAKMAQDSSMIQANMGWVAAQYQGMFSITPFPGYTYLAELAMRPEYRVMFEITATEMCRKWIKLEIEGGESDQSDEIEHLNEELERLQVREKFQESAEQEGAFGRTHIYMDTGATDDLDELITPIGDGASKISDRKFKKGSLKRLVNVEPMWTYPLNYNAIDPLKPTWYKPEIWTVMAKQVHASRILTFVGREVPDMFKPAYSFGGLSLSQIAEPYVNNWLRTRDSISELLHTFSVSGIMTNLAGTLATGGDEMFARVDLFNALRDNRGLMMLDKETEEFFNMSTPLSGLDLLQAQAQEHMAAISRIPIVKLLGIQPAGLNASSEGEMESFGDWINAYQVLLFDRNLRVVLNFAQRNIWGKVNPKIKHSWVPLREADETVAAQIRKTDAETDMIYIQGSVVDAAEVRKRLATTAESPYAGLDPDDMPELPESVDEEAEGGGPDDEEDDSEDDGDKADEQPKPPAKKGAKQ